MLERQRQHDEVRERTGGEPTDGGAQGGSTGVDYYNVVDNVINNTISSDSEAFNLQIEQENGQ